MVLLIETNLEYVHCFGDKNGGMKLAKVFPTDRISEVMSQTFPE